MPLDGGSRRFRAASTRSAAHVLTLSPEVATPKHSGRLETRTRLRALKTPVSADAQTRTIHFHTSSDGFFHSTVVLAVAAVLVIDFLRLPRSRYITLKRAILLYLLRRVAMLAGFLVWKKVMKESKSLRQVNSWKEMKYDLLGNLGGKYGIHANMGWKYGIGTNMGWKYGIDINVGGNGK